MTLPCILSPHASYQDGLRAMGSIAVRINKNIRRKDRKRHRLEATQSNVIARNDQEIQVPLPVLVKPEFPSVDPAPVRPPQPAWLSMNTSQPQNPMPQPTLAVEDRSAERGPSQELTDASESDLTDTELTDSDSGSDSESEYAEDENVPDREALVELGCADNLQDLPNDDPLAKSVILVESKKPNGMKLCYQFRDLVSSHTGRLQPFCVDQMKWNVFSNKLQREMNFDVQHDRLKVTSEGVCCGASIINDSSLRGLLQLQLQLGTTFIVLEITSRGDIP